MSKLTDFLSMKFGPSHIGQKQKRARQSRQSKKLEKAERAEHFLQANPKGIVKPMKPLR